MAETVVLKMCCDGIDDRKRNWCAGSIARKVSWCPRPCKHWSTPSPDRQLLGPGTLCGTIRLFVRAGPNKFGTVRTGYGLDRQVTLPVEKDERWGWKFNQSGRRCCSGQSSLDIDLAIIATAGFYDDNKRFYSSSYLKTILWQIFLLGGTVFLSSVMIK